MKKTRGAVNLFFEHDAETRQRKLDLTARRLKQEVIDRPKREARQALLDKISHARFRPQDRGPSDLLNEIFESEGVNLDDGYLRLVIINKWGYLEVFNGERFGAEMFGLLSMTARGAKELARFKAPTATFPWKLGFFVKAAITRVEWCKDLKQYKVFVPMEGASKRTAKRRGLGVNYYFLPRYEDSQLGKDWKKPRPQYSSVTIPLSKT